MVAPMGDTHIHIHIDTWAGDKLLRVLSKIDHTLQKGFTKMSDASDALVTAVTQVATEIDNLSTSQQTEIQQIIDALNGEAMRTCGRPSINRFPASRPWPRKCSR